MQAIVLVQDFDLLNSDKILFPSTRHSHTMLFMNFSSVSDEMLKGNVLVEWKINWTNSPAREYLNNKPSERERCNNIFNNL